MIQSARVGGSTQYGNALLVALPAASVVNCGALTPDDLALHERLSGARPALTGAPLRCKVELHDD